MLDVGFIGVGGISTVHLNYLARRRDVRIAALCDIDARTVAKRVAMYGGRSYRDFRVMLESERLDAVWICTPPQVRREPLRECAQRGIAVLCEKPVARTQQDAARIARELAALDARVQIGYLFRSLPVVSALREALADDRIHLVQSLYACPMSIEMRMPAWFFDKELSGGALIDQATHNFDLLRALLGEVREVRGRAHNPVKAKRKGYTIDETIALTMLFANDTLCAHTHSWVGDAWRNEIVFSGEKRLYRLWPGDQVLTIEERGSKRTIRHRKGMYTYQNAVFIEQVRSGKWASNPCSFDDGVRTLALTLACDRAVDTGRTVRVG
jgi:predicted dehydrogenase